ncbi:hypothetical protein EHRUM4_07590 [Ehrlichia ruminantium]|uniref:Uncharacterized protein n=1 Tax=Ehrlichia ruminantium TaxID=779 RepID=A0A170T7Z8_EHRRU|nr:hypothetical protein EHRUM4_07590 [Ehrlichia ruminantium]GAT77515.1 hypothetical protein EHRUM2_07410 [Ehrlichia ruminantium]GAT78658.1 hypothetical protein EHRUM3_08870 [Ehrlichia ruminantium]
MLHCVLTLNTFLLTFTYVDKVSILQVHFMLNAILAKINANFYNIGYGDERTY